ncbi:MAG: CoA-binding protein, partial [Candidatus Promineifilaceae bacterium]
MTDLRKGTSHNVLRYTGNPLDVMFAPRSVAVIGASEREGSIGRIVLSNLLNSPFQGEVFAVNPLYTTVQGIECHSRVGQIKKPIDLAVIATPGDVVPGIVRECVESGVKSAVILSAGFRETGPKGAALEEAVMAEARKGSIRLVGPNCLGIMNPYHGLNATFASHMALKGNVGFASQSGALFTAIVDWSIRENVGISGFVSTGSMIDVDWGDLIYYFGDDPRTKSILIYMETIG